MINIGDAWYSTTVVLMLQALTEPCGVIVQRFDL